MKKVDKIQSIMVRLNGRTYFARLEANSTAQDFAKSLPLSCFMSDKEGREKFFYLSSSFPPMEMNPGTLMKGDLMLFGDRCLCLFNKTYDTKYSYTKIGHIDQMEDLGNTSIMVDFSRVEI